MPYVFCWQKTVVKGCVIKTATHATFDHVFWQTISVWNCSEVEFIRSIVASERTELSTCCTKVSNILGSPLDARGRTLFSIPALQRLLFDLAPLTRSISLPLLHGHSTVSYELCFPLPSPCRPSPLLRTLLDRGRKERAKKRGSYDIKAACSSCSSSSSLPCPPGNVASSLRKGKHRVLAKDVLPRGAPR